MKKVILILGLFVYTIGYAQTPFYGKSSFTVKKDTLQRNDSGKFILEVKNKSYYTEILGDKLYIEQQPANRGKIQSVTETVMAIIKQYKKNLGGNIEVDYFEPKIIWDNNQYFCYDELFDKQYYEANKTLNYDMIYKWVGSCLFNIYIQYDIIPGELRLHFWCDGYNIGYIIDEK